MGFYRDMSARVTRVVSGFAVMALLPALAHAQSFTNTTVGDINDSTFCAGGTNANGNGVVNDLVRTFSVTGLTNVTDLNVGFVATHSWRGDMDVRLVSPAGTTLQLINPDTSGAGNLDNYNIELSDEATDTVNEGAHNAANDVNAPLYQFLVAPDVALSAFDGQNPNGTWELRICDDYTGEVGQFRSAELVFAPATGADLSLFLSVDNAFPQAGDTLTFTLTASSEGPQNSTPTAQFNLPPGLTFVSSSGDGSYNSGTGVWSIGSGFTPGVPRSRTIVATAGGVGSYPVTAEIQSSNRADIDSTPNNGVTTEDDYDALNVNVQPPSTPPALTCDAADKFELAFDAPGGTNDWAAGALIESFTVFDPVNAENISIDFDISDPSSGLGAVGGSPAPVTQDEYTGGISPAEFSVAVAADFATSSEFVTMDIDLGNANIGVGGIQFTIFDVDLGGWTDRLQFRGYLNGAIVDPILTPSATNFVRTLPSGRKEIIGRSGNAEPTSGAGNVTVTFNQAIDRMEWDYGNDASAGPDPAFQIIAMHTLEMCGRRLADLSAVKTVEVFDPSNEGLYMTPGNEVLYRITVTNSDEAKAQADDVDISDTLPENLKFVSATTTGFTGGTFGSPALPATNTDCGDVPNPCVIRFAGGSVPIDTTAEIIVRALIK